MDDDLKGIIMILVLLLSMLIVLILGIAIPCLISEKRNIEKELTLKEIEVYGERINKDE